VFTARYADTFRLRKLERLMPCLGRPRVSGLLCVYKEWSVQSAERIERQYYKYTLNVIVCIKKAVTQSKSQENITDFQIFFFFL
jgi:hypothetical protein